MTHFKINHIAIAVTDLDAALSFWRDTLTLPLEHVEDVPQEKARIAFFAAGDAHVELVAATTDDSGLAQFIAKRGAGLHHLCLETDDLDGMIAHLRAQDVQLLAEAPQIRGDWRYIFVHPRSTGGVLLELYERIGAADA